MSRPAAAVPTAGLAALRAAVAEAQAEERARRARAARGAGALALAGAGCARAATPARRGGTGTAPAVVVPAPAAAADDAVPAAGDDAVASPPEQGHAPAEGDSATALRLVERAQSGDADAFGELYDRYVDVVYRYISYRVGDRALAEDMTSETFLRALRRIGSFTWQGRDVGAWFVTIARNLIADHYKSSRYKLEMTTDDVGVVGGTAGRLVEESPEGAVLESMQNKVLLEAVRQLNAEQQECIALRFLQGLSVAETAAVMGKNEGAVKALQYRAVRTLGRLLPEGVEL
ncbi:MAG TPA: ECF subfamily RNA polymerase sigma factor, BldN family [Mycobacteriales bacterium]|nr:ECF subfamily RNA polymerase sigma factor, BldN family [Mycobacteriales bacterium]